MYTYLKQLSTKPDLTADFFKNTQIRTAEACGLSERTVRRICSEAKEKAEESTSVMGFKSPRKGYKRAKIVSELGDFDSDVVRRTVHEFYDRGEYPTVQLILNNLRQKINFSGCLRSTQYLLKNLKFSYKKCNDGRKFLMERNDIVALRCKFLREICTLREMNDGRPIVYIDETWVNQNHSRSMVWQNEHGTEGLKIPTGKGGRLIVCHAGCARYGFIQGSKLVFRSNTGNTVDYHSQINAEIFKNWFIQLLNNLEEPSVLVMDNASYHSTLVENCRWWTDELTESKRSLERARREGLPDTNRQAYQRQRNQHLHKIRLAKMSSWREFSADMNVNRWGKAFKWAKSGSRKNPMPTTVKTSTGTYTTDLKDTLDTFLEAYLPEDQNTPAFVPYDHQADNTPADSTNAQEVKEAIWKMKPGRAPGLDGITAKMLRVVCPVISDSITDLYDNCLRTAKFPNCWKNACLVIIPKGKGKNPLLTGSYRPISLLPTLGKALESLITLRLEKETGLNEIGQQHGYVSGRSTETAIKALYNWTDQCTNRIVVGAFLDITGAFDYVRWTPIFERLKVLKISNRTLALLESYLTNRTATLSSDNETRVRPMTRGCPQGSRLGPTLWKVAMSDAFKSIGHQSHMIAYADDIALAVGAARLDTVKKRLMEYFDQLTSWSNKYGLNF